MRPHPVPLSDLTEVTRLDLQRRRPQKAKTTARTLVRMRVLAVVFVAPILDTGALHKL